MANSHINFLNFEQRISLTPLKKQKLISSRQALQNRIINYFRNKTDLTPPKFYIQGSYKMKTMVLGSAGEYDVDLGVYFLFKPQVTPATIKSYVFNAIEPHTQFYPENRDKCIRVVYSGDFDIDLPVYYKSTTDRHPYLATKKGWLLSDPKELCDWFEKKKDKNGQLKRIVKYFKYWANMRTKKMPSGIALSVWVAIHYKTNSRDDIAFYETAKAIRESFFWGVTCPNPATPKDDLVAKLDDNQKSNFKNYLDHLIKDAKEAIEQKDTIKAINIWKQQFGQKFSL